MDFTLYIISLPDGQPVFQEDFCRQLRTHLDNFLDKNQKDYLANIEARSSSFPWLVARYLIRWACVRDSGERICTNAAGYVQFSSGRSLNFSYGTGFGFALSSKKVLNRNIRVALDAERIFDLKQLSYIKPYIARILPAGSMGKPWENGTPSFFTRLWTQLEALYKFASQQYGSQSKVNFELLLGMARNRILSCRSLPFQGHFITFLANSGDNIIPEYKIFSWRNLIHDF